MKNLRLVHLFGIFIVVTLASFTANADFPQSYNFFHFNKNDGLSHNQVHCILQDSRGFIWVGTTSGLNRHDGNNFRVFKQNTNDPNSLSENNIFHIFEDSQGNLAENNGGMGHFQPNNELFRHWLMCRWAL
jgi:ligand-binding sensor domain-containing protein